MAKKDTVKPWFKRGAYPTETQFSTLFDDLRFNDTPLEISEVNGLGDAINGKADSATVAGKADKTYVDTGLSAKADLSSGKVPTTQLPFPIKANTFFTTGNTASNAALRVGDVLSNIVDDNSGENLTFNKVSNWVNGAAMDDTKVDGIIYRKSGTEYFRRNFTRINVEWFRSAGNDRQTIQAAFNLLQNLKYGYGDLVLYIPAGRVYNIDQPLTLNTTSDVMLVGDGIRKSAIIATAAMDAMIYIGKDTPFTGRCQIKGLTFNDGGFADCCIDARGLRYSLIQENEIVTNKDNGIGIRLNNWVQVIKRNLFTGVSVNGTIGMKVYQSGSSNSINILENNFSSYNIGLQIDDVGNSINVAYNTFDTCPGAGIYCSFGARGISIENNYFEACGATGLSITKGAPGSTVETWKGAIIAHHYYGSGDTWINGLIIKKNQFANVSDVDNGVITLSGINYCSIEDNFSYYPYFNKYFVDLRWQGVFYTQSNFLKVEHSVSQNGQFTGGLVGLNADDKTGGLSNIIIRPKLNVPQGHYQGLPTLNNPFLWGTTPLSNFHETDGYNGFQTFYYRGTGSNFTQTLNIDLSVYPQFKGRYFRVNWYSKGIGQDIGWNLNYKIDGVLYATYGSTSKDVWVNAGRNATIYIPTTAAAISFEWLASNGPVPRMVAGFSITPCDKDFNESSALPCTDLAMGMYLNGGTPNGFQNARVGRLCLSLPDGKIYKKTTVYSDNTGWVVLGDIASQAEVTAGTDTLKIVTPATLKGVTDLKAPLAAPTFTGNVTASALAGVGSRFVMANTAGLLSAGANPTTVAGFGITDAYYPRGGLANATDLNTVTAIGSYLASSGTTSLVNAPAEYTGNRAVLDVDATTVYIVQRLYVLATGFSYYRTSDGATWSNWSKLSTISLGTPTIAIGASFTGTVSIVGSGTAGEITLNISASTAFAALASILSVTFGTAYGTTPSVVITPSNDLAADSTTNFAGPVYVKGVATTGFSIASAKAGNSVIGTFKWMYRVN